MNNQLFNLGLNIGSLCTENVEHEKLKVFWILIISEIKLIKFVNSTKRTIILPENLHNCTSLNISAFMFINSKLLSVLSFPCKFSDVTNFHSILTSLISCHNFSLFSSKFWSSFQTPVFLLLSFLPCLLSSYSIFKYALSFQATVLIPSFPCRLFVLNYGSPLLAVSSQPILTSIFLFFSVFHQYLFLSRVSQKRYTCLMSHKKVTIALILEIWLGFDSQSLKLDHDMKNNHFGSLSIRLNSQPLFENWRKSVKNKVLKIYQLDEWNFNIST